MKKLLLILFGLTVLISTYAQNQYKYPIYTSGLRIGATDRWASLTQVDSFLVVGNMLTYYVGSTPYYSFGANTVILADGTVPLTANWDVGAYTITGLRFISDQATGTSPFTVASTTVVTNLNADLLDGQSGAYYLDGDAALSDTSSLLATKYDLDTLEVGGGTGDLSWSDTAVIATKYDLDTLSFLYSSEVAAMISDSLQAAWASGQYGVSLADSSGTAAGTYFTGYDASVLQAEVDLNTAKVTNATHTGDVTGSGALTISNDAVDEEHINWGTGASQVSGADVPIADAGGYFTGTDVEAALQELGPGSTASNIALDSITMLNDSTHMGFNGSDTTMAYTPKDRRIQLPEAMEYIIPDHAILRFRDSAVNLTGTQDTWYQVTNTYDALFNVEDMYYSDSITLTADTLIINGNDHYKVMVKLVLSTVANETVEVQLVQSGPAGASVVVLDQSDHATTGVGTDPFTAVLMGYVRADTQGSRVWLRVRQTTSTATITLVDGYWDMTWFHAVSD